MVLTNYNGSKAGAVHLVLGTGVGGGEGVDMASHYFLEHLDYSQSCNVLAI